MLLLEYLASLKDLIELAEFAWDEHILTVAMREVKKYQEKRKDGVDKFWIAGCLPMFMIIYMDVLDVPRPLNVENRIVYSLPRACFVCDAYFKLVAEIDRNRLILNKIDFRKRNFRALSDTPYTAQVDHNQVDCQNQNQCVDDARIPNRPTTDVVDELNIGGDFVDL